VEDGAFGDGAAEHLFEAHGLRAELQLVGEAGSPATGFVFDRYDGAVRVELDGVSAAGEAEAAGEEWEGAFDTDLAAAVRSRRVGALVQQVAAAGERVVRPDSVQVDERGLARAVGPVLQGGDGDEVCQNQRSRVTPDGTSCSFKAMM